MLNFRGEADRKMFEGLNKEQVEAVRAAWEAYEEASKDGEIENFDELLRTALGRKLNEVDFKNVFGTGNPDLEEEIDAVVENFAKKIPKDNKEDLEKLRRRTMFSHLLVTYIREGVERLWEEVQNKRRVRGNKEEAA